MKVLIFFITFSMVALFAACYFSDASWPYYVFSYFLAVFVGAMMWFGYLLIFPKKQHNIDLKRTWNEK